MYDNTTLLIDPDTMDLAFTPSSDLAQVHNHDTTAQCVRLTLQTHKGDFFLDQTHGTEWNKILGRKLSAFEEDEAEETLRAAVLQEKGVKYVDSLTISQGELAREMAVAFEGTLADGKPVSVEVSMSAV